MLPCAKGIAMLEMSSDFNPIRKAMQDIQTKCGKIALENALMEAAKKGAVKAESLVSPYPQASGKPLPAIYQRIVEAKKPYIKTVQGARVRVIPGDTFMSKFPSLAASRGYFWHLKNGDIGIPYRRTGTLGKSITSRVQRDPNAVLIYVGTKVPYAALVIGSPAEQAPYHRGTWTPLRSDIERGIDSVAAVIRQSLVEYLRKRS
jgi:hypothetical protein